MFEICLFDLDDTLIRTEDLKDVREACKNNAEPKRLKKLRADLESEKGRHVYSLEILQKIRTDHPELKLGVFTKSPRSYAETALAWAYPGFEWDIVVAYEDVDETKPHGEGIDNAMAEFDVDSLDSVMLVGDNDTDVRAAYNCGCLITLDEGTWPWKHRNADWRALGLVPDAVINSPDELLDVLASPDSFLPELERLLAEEPTRARGYRFDKINHFIPAAAGGDHTAYPMHVCGRSFSNHASVKYRKQWHTLSDSIEEHKDADHFPDQWVNAIRHFLASQYGNLFVASASVLVTVVPHRPGRKPRLENLLKQLKQSIDEKPIPRRKVTIAPGLLAYKDGVKSQHKEFLGADDRAINVRDHLYVKTPNLLKDGGSILVLDDVVTTGASLIFAYKYLKDAGAAEVKCLAMAKNIGDIFK